MTDMLTPRHSRSRTVQAALAVMIGLGFSTPSLALDPKPPSAKSRPYYKEYVEQGVTIIILDEDARSSSKAPKPELKAKADKPAPSSRIKRDDDDTVIIIKKSRKTGGKLRPGPKVIIVDKTTGSPCTGSGVCIIRP